MDQCPVSQHAAFADVCWTIRRDGRPVSDPIEPVHESEPLIDEWGRAWRLHGVQREKPTKYERVVADDQPDAQAAGKWWWGRGRHPGRRCQPAEIADQRARQVPQGRAPVSGSHGVVVAVPLVATARGSWTE